MKNKALKIFVTTSLVVVVLLAVYFPYLMISPGEPIAAHADIAKDCFACHTPFIGSTSEKCMACHKIEEIGKKTTKGQFIAMEDKNVTFHQQLIEANCVSCHSDHKGVKPFRPISQFSHNLLEPGLQKQCESCHKGPRDSLHQKIKGNCVQCHNQNTWTPATFDHETYFRFDRDHETECETCHIDNDYTSYTCYGCHEHSRSGIREEHLEEGIRDYENCVECHRSGDEDEAKHLWKSRKNRDFKYNRQKSDHDDDDDDDDEKDED